MTTTPDWQVTATTIYCDAVDEDVTILVNKDWSTKCTGYRKYIESPTKDILNTLKKRAKKASKNLACEGPEDSRVTDYRDKLKAEEDAKVKS